MADNKYSNTTQTSTQIRNMYSDGLSYLNIKFFNTNLSFSFYPFVSKDQMGKNTYDLKNGQSTTVNFEGAYALFKSANDIISGKVQGMNLPIPCAAGATLILERKLGQNGLMETVFSITKNNITIPFKFQTLNQQVEENGQIVTKTIESGLGAFMKTVEGYLTGINADRHLNKLTDDYVKLQEQQNPQQNQYNNNYSNNYNKKQYQNNSGYRKNYQNNSYQQNQQNGWNQRKQQNMSSYQIPN